MVYHPRENWNPRTRKRVYTRRDFIQRAALLGIAFPALPSLLAACAEREGSGPADLAIGTPASPVQQPLFDDNPAIESDLEPESGPLKLYNWEDYINPEIIPVAAEALGVEIEEATFFNEEDALARLASGEVAYDVWFPTSQRVPVAVAAELIQPLNHDYLPNLNANVWPQLADPYYDQGSRYTVPYVTYSSGIGWRTDMVDSADIEGSGQPLGRLLEHRSTPGTWVCSTRSPTPSPWRCSATGWRTHPRPPRQSWRRQATRWSS